MHLHWQRSATQSGTTWSDSPDQQLKLTASAHHHPQTDHHSAAPAEAASNDSGQTLVQLLRTVPIVPETQTLDIDVRVHNFAVPPDNRYHCKIVHLEQLAQRRRHLVQFEPIITYPGLLHHMELFHCVAGKPAMPDFEGDCAEEAAAVTMCARVVALWALGSEVWSGSVTIRKDC